MTRNQTINRLRELGYTGPVSYTKPRLAEILAGVEAQVAELNRIVNGVPCPDDTHCENCGNTDYEDLQNQYSGCCNEIIVSGPSDCRGFHKEN